MQTVILELPLETAQQMLVAKEKELIALMAGVTAKEAEVAAIRTAIKRVHHSEPINSLPLSVEKRPGSGRARKGEAERVIVTFLQSHIGDRFTFAQIAEKTGVTLSTARRNVNRLLAENKLGQIGHTFAWAA